MDSATRSNVARVDPARRRFANFMGFDGVFARSGGIKSPLFPPSRAGRCRNRASRGVPPSQFVHYRSVVTDEMLYPAQESAGAEPRLNDLRRVPLWPSNSTVPTARRPSAFRTHIPESEEAVQNAGRNWWCRMWRRLHPRVLPIRQPHRLQRMASQHLQRLPPAVPQSTNRFNRRPA